MKKEKEEEAKAKKAAPPLPAIGGPKKPEPGLEVV